VSNISNFRVFVVKSKLRFIINLVSEKLSLHYNSTGIQTIPVLLFVGKN